MDPASSQNGFKPKQILFSPAMARDERQRAETVTPRQIDEKGTEVLKNRLECNPRSTRIGHRTGLGNRP
jgi:hypothetical protein